MNHQSEVIAATVRSVAGGSGVQPAQVALAWVMAQADRLGIPVVPIPGTKRPEWVEQNAAATAVELDDEAIAQLDPLGDLVVGGRYGAIDPSLPG